MNPVEPMMNELRHEAMATRTLMERIPEKEFGWKPHEKSMSLGELASHIAESIGWAGVAIDQDEYLMNPAEYKPWVASGKDELLAMFDRKISEALEALERLTPDKLDTIWTLRSEKKVLLQMPRIAVFRSFIISHMIHHRGQLTVYLRMKNVPLPSIYGPTADEPMDMG